MTSYQGGKKRLGKEISKVILDFEKKMNKNNLKYFEPFCGMCGVMVHLAKENKREIHACDINKDIICMWKGLQNGWIPPDSCTKEEYLELKKSVNHSAKRGFIGVVCSFGAQFFKGNYRTKSKTYDFVKGGKKGVLKASDILKNVTFCDSQSYDAFNYSGCLIYCDPPYKDNNVSNYSFQNFDHDNFWETIREWSKTNIVIISEKYAPDDFVSIWEKEYKVSFYNNNNNNNKKKIYNEKLFVHQSYLKSKNHKY